MLNRVISDYVIARVPTAEGKTGNMAKNNSLSGKFCQNTEHFVCCRPNFPDSKDQDIALFAAKFPNFIFLSTECVLYMKHHQITEIGTGKICLPTGKQNRENTGNLKIEFEWGPCIAQYVHL